MENLNTEYINLINELGLENEKNWLPLVGDYDFSENYVIFEKNEDDNFYIDFVKYLNENYGIEKNKCSHEYDCCGCVTCIKFIYNSITINNNDYVIITNHKSLNL